MTPDKPLIEMSSTLKSKLPKFISELERMSQPPPQRRRRPEPPDDDTTMTTEHEEAD